ncbi:hypothetical protein POREN0001_0327 [Porphyromonas endodontalis ATCC 35406]|uniref:Uncharacterized protein n=1 Tax=Porphyromonas endodontalis (strain ATCC 35406 / DSM 24491 / JCM 8526 / CCUG 16442 / BCRC 14492 / NCTC 13058 / HG 370) TaxID=553175 RepID=C3JAT8_POREA|nr:hypothetical protein POREN0001_0327 [Porphyromonas endodontalis ATCC 35406]
MRDLEKPRLLGTLFLSQSKKVATLDSEVSRLSPCDIATHTAGL